MPRAEPKTDSDSPDLLERSRHLTVLDDAFGVEDLSNGAVSIDRSRTSVGNYLRYGKFRKGVSFALFGTNTVNGEVHTLWCVGNIEVVRAKGGRTRVTANLSCPVS